MALNSVLGLYSTPEAAADAAIALREAGISNKDYDVLTGSPYPEGAFGEPIPEHKLFVYPIIGAICGFTAGILITGATQMSYPLVTGGKPLLAIPPMMVITYEGTMLGAILFTILGCIFESRLPNLSGGAYDPRILRDGMIGLVVAGDDSLLRTAETVFKSSAAEDIVFDTPGKVGSAR